MIRDGMVASSGVQQCTKVCNWVLTCAKGRRYLCREVQGCLVVCSDV